MCLICPWAILLSYTRRQVCQNSPLARLVLITTRYKMHLKPNRLIIWILNRSVVSGSAFQVEKTHRHSAGGVPVYSPTSVFLFVHFKVIEPQHGPMKYPIAQEICCVNSCLGVFLICGGRGISQKSGFGVEVDSFLRGALCPGCYLAAQWVHLRGCAPAVTGFLGVASAFFCFWKLLLRGNDFATE